MSEPRTDERRPWWRKLDLIGPDGSTFLRRRGFDLRRGGGVMIHRIDGPDPGLDLHDHPWWFVTVILRGGYTEEWAEIRMAQTFAKYAAKWDTCNPGHPRTWRRGSVHRMPLHVAHRITACEPNTVTLMIRGPKVRRWGFYEPTGWTDWESYDYEGRRPLSVASNVVDGTGVPQ